MQSCPPRASNLMKSRGASGRNGGPLSGLAPGWQVSEGVVLKLSPGRLRNSQESKISKDILCKESSPCKGMEA